MSSSEREERPMAATHCTACEGELSPADGSETDYHFENALWIGFHGGYSMFIDGDPSSIEGSTLGASAEAVLCHDCAHSLCEALPWIAQLIRPELSHAHLPEFWVANPDHIGWDRPDLMARYRAGESLERVLADLE